MSDVFYLRPTGGRATAADVLAMGVESGGCFDLHRVNWMRSFLAEAGDRMMCCYRAPDAESARLALRELGADTNAVWSGQILPDDQGLLDAPVRLLLELSFAQAVDAADAMTMLNDAVPRATLCAGVRSLNGREVVGLYSSESPASARDLLLPPAGATAVSAWICEAVTPLK